MRTLFAALLALAWTASSAGGNCATEFLQAHRESTELAEANNGLLRNPARYFPGYLRNDPQPLYAMRGGQPDPTQPLGFRRIWLPKAQTGIFVPSDVDLADPKSITGYDGYLIVLPGIGTDRSDATTLFTLGQTFQSGSDSALKVEGRERKIRLLPILLDATLNGMASNAPFYFGAHEVSISVVRHVRLLLRAAFPGSPCFLAGRSQGGLIAMEYADWYGDVDGVMAVNPSPTRPDLHRLAMQLGTANLNTVMDTPVRLNRSFDSYAGHTESYVSFGTHSFWHRLHRRLIRAGRRGNAPLLLLLGTKDEGYPPEYFDFAAQFVSELPAAREMALFEGPHDLWSRRNKQLYRSVVRRMAEFVAPKLR